MRKNHLNQQCAVYSFQGDLCDASYVGYTLRHLHQCVSELKNVSSSIGEHYKNKHSAIPKNLDKRFSVLKKCNNKFNCLVHEMLLMRELAPSLNVQLDAIRAKLFVTFAYFISSNLQPEKLFWQFISKHFELDMGSRWHRNVVLSCPHCFILELCCALKIINYWKVTVVEVNKNVRHAKVQHFCAFSI